MPWTFAHPAAVLPLRRIGRLELPLLGLFLGSLSPDFGYYIGRFDWAAVTHSFVGLAFCVPPTLALALLIVKLRHILVAPLPEPHRSAIARLKAIDILTIRGASRMCLAALIGALTHIIWDSFTHSYGAAVKVLPALQQQLGSSLGRSVHVYNLLQHVSTVAGMAVLLIAYYRWLRRQPAEASRTPGSDRSRYAWLLACVLGSAIVGATVSLYRYSPTMPISVFVVRGVIYASVAFAVFYLAVAIRCHQRAA